MIQVELVDVLDLPLDIVVDVDDLILEIVPGPFKLGSDLIDELLVRRHHVLVFLNQLSVLGKGLRVGLKAHLVLDHHVLIVPLDRCGVASVLGESLI